MRFDKYLKNNEFKYLKELICLGEYIELNEVSNETFKEIRHLPGKMGFKVTKTDTIFSYLKRASKGVDELFRIASLYLITDIKDSKSRAELVRDAKKEISKLNIKEVTAFLLQLDKSSLGLTSQIRHILISVFGIEITTYNKWMEDVKFIKDELRQIKIVLKRMKAGDKEFKALENFEKLILQWGGEK